MINNANFYKLWLEDKLILNVCVRKEWFGGILFSVRSNEILAVKKNSYIILCNFYNKTKFKKVIESNEEVFKNYINKLFQTLYNSNFLFIRNNDIDTEDNKLKIFDKNSNIIESGDFSAPLIAHYYIGYKCNQNCTFCYLKDQQVKNSDDLLPEQIKKVSDKVFEFVNKNRIPVLNLIGGEPFLYKDVIFNLLNKVNNITRISIVSNGTGNNGLSYSEAKILAKNKVSIRISLHSSIEELHNKLVGDNKSYEIVIKTIKNLVEAGVNVSVSCVPTKYNILNIPDLARMCNNLGVKNFSVLQFYSKNKKTLKMCATTEQYQACFNELKIIRKELENLMIVDWADKYNLVDNDFNLSNFVAGCSAGKSIIEISQEGYIYPCHASLNNKEYKLGNVLTTQFEDIWHSSILDKFRLRRNNILDERCRVCSNLCQCKGGCPIIADEIGEGFMASDCTCPALLKHMNE